MTPRIFIGSYIVAIMLGICPPSSRAGYEVNPDTIRVLIPRFFSQDASLGRSVSSILNLQIWQTLRRDLNGIPTFGTGAMRLTSDTLEVPDHEEAAKMAREIPAQLVVWGKTYQLGTKTTVLTYLTIPLFDDHRKKHFEVWHLRFDLADKPLFVDADIPTRQYAFEPFTLNQEIVQNYSAPESIRVTSTPNGGRVVGYASPDSDFVSLPDSESLLPQSDIHVSVHGTRGWIHLPDLSEKRSEVVDFVGGMVRIFRGDWQGASELLTRAMNYPDLPTQLLVDCNLYLALANFNLGRDFEDNILAAERLSPSASRVVRYRVMSKLAALQKAEAERRAAIIEDARTYLDMKRKLFSEHDKWLSEVDTLIARLSKS